MAEIFKEKKAAAMQQKISMVKEEERPSKKAGKSKEELAEIRKQMMKRPTLNT